MFRVSTQLDKKYPLKFNNQKHKIYPVFGKRSIASNAEREMMVEKLLDDEERRFHLEHHRSTRNVLYSRIEKYLHSYVYLVQWAISNIVRRKFISF